MTMEPNDVREMTGRELLAHLRIGHLHRTCLIKVGDVEWWTWRGGDGLIHMSTSIYAQDAAAPHRVGGLDEKVGDFQPCENNATIRQRLVDAGWRVEVDTTSLRVFKGQIPIHQEPSDLPLTERYARPMRARLLARGWAIAARKERKNV